MVLTLWVGVVILAEAGLLPQGPLLSVPLGYLEGAHTNRHREAIHREGLVRLFPQSVVM